MTECVMCLTTMALPRAATTCAYRAARAKSFLVDEFDRTVTALEEMEKAP